MLKELLNGKCRIRLESAEMKALDEPTDETGEIEANIKDSLAWQKNQNSLRVECTRSVKFVPECGFEVKVVYSVEHYLKDDGSLNAFSDEAIKKEIYENIPFYIQEKRGLMNHVTLIIAQLTAAFNNSPMILPPYFQGEE